MKLLPEYLQDQGYRTYGFGKWNIGHCNVKYLPHERGFNYFLGYNCPGHGERGDTEYAWPRPKDRHNQNLEFCVGTRGQERVATWTGERLTDDVDGQKMKGRACASFTRTQAALFILVAAWRGTVDDIIGVVCRLLQRGLILFHRIFCLQHTHTLMEPSTGRDCMEASVQRQVPPQFFHISSLQARPRPWWCVRWWFPSRCFEFRGPLPVTL